MPFLAPLAVAVGGAVTGAVSWLAGGTLLAQIAVAGLGLAAKYIIGMLSAPKPQASSVQLETIYGEATPRTVIFGYCGTAGHRVFRNAYGEGNRQLQDVFRLCDFRITDITRARFKGAWQTYSGTDVGDMGERLNGTGDAVIYSKWYLGTLVQTANAHLISQSGGRWTYQHRGAGVAYVYVHNSLHREALQQPWEPFWEVKGAPLYDWRLDSTVGGTGAHRWDDQDTWEFTENPVLMMYALERGIYVNGELMVGKGVPASRLPLSYWTVAANICDETPVGIAKRYTAGCIVAAGDGVTHDQNMQPLLDACAGSWVETAEGEYPVVGALQSPAFTFTDDDLIPSAPLRYSYYRTRGGLVNTVAARYQSRDKFYNTVPLATRIDTDAMSDDGERLASSIPLTAVNDSGVGDRLADIAIKASRFQANADIVLRPRFMEIVIGQWVRWESAKYGTKDWQVLRMQYGPIAEEGTRNAHLSLQQVGAGIFDPTDYETLPPIPLPPNVPVYANEASNFSVAAITFENDTSQLIPALQFTWDPFNDVTVIAVEIEYRKVGTTESISKIANVPATVLRTTDGILSDTDMEYRHRIITSPLRTTAFTDWATVHTTEASAPGVIISIQNLQDDLYDHLYNMARELGDLRDRMELIAADTADSIGANVEQHAIAKRFQDATAVVLTEQSASIQQLETGLAAQAQSLTTVLAQIGPAAAQGLFRITAEATSSGAQATIGISVSATAEGATKAASILLDALASGESRVIFAGDKIVIMDAEGTIQALFDDDGATIRNAFILNLTGDNISFNTLTGDHIMADTITGDNIEFNTLTGDHIVVASIDSPSLAFNSVTDYYDIGWLESRSGGASGFDDGSYVTKATTVVPYNTSATPMLELCTINIQGSYAGTGGLDLISRLFRDGTAAGNLLLQAQKTSNGGAPVISSITNYRTDGSTSHTYYVHMWNQILSNTSWSFVADVQAGVLRWKR
jgi:hypothetical protein